MSEMTDKWWIVAGFLYVLFGALAVLGGLCVGAFTSIRHPEFGTGAAIAAVCLVGTVVALFAWFSLAGGGTL